MTVYVYTYVITTNIIIYIHMYVYTYRKGHTDLCAYILYTRLCVKT